MIASCNIFVLYDWEIWIALLSCHLIMTYYTKSSLRGEFVGIAFIKIAGFFSLDRGLIYGKNVLGV